MVSIEKRKFGFRKRTGTKLLRDIISNDSAVDISEAFTESKNGAAEESFYVSVDDPSEEFQNSINGTSASLPGELEIRYPSEFQAVGIIWL